MPREVARRAIDYFLEEYPGGAHGRRNGSTQRCSPTPDAHPFQAQTYSIACDNPDDQNLDRELVRWVTNHALTRGQELGKRVEIAPLTTSGVGITEDLLAEWQRDGGPPQERRASPPRVTVSIDGTRWVHDGLRRWPDGSGSQQVAIRAITLLKAADLMGDVMAVVTPQCSDVALIWDHLTSLTDCRVGTRPVRASPNSAFAWTARNVRELCDGYTRLAEMLVQSPGDLLLADLKGFTPGDYFFRFVLRLFRGDRLPYRCGAARDQFKVDADGEIYGCDGFVGNRALSIGNIAQGIDSQRHAVYWTDLHVDNLPWCRACWARYLCGGPCYHQAHLSHGRLERPERAECVLNLHLIALAKQFLDTVCERHPQVLPVLRALAAGAPPRAAAFASMGHAAS
jgi:radical SAM protein with 4Fe4S-binding SPASM domain